MVGSLRSFSALQLLRRSHVAPQPHYGAMCFTRVDTRIYYAIKLMRVDC